MSPHGRPKGELTAARKREGFLMSPHGRPKGELTAARKREGFLMSRHGRPKGEFPRLAGRRVAPGVLK